MKEIKLTRGYVAQVDDEDYDYLMQWNWFATPARDGMCAKTSIKTIEGKRKHVFMHRMIMDTPKGMEVDHKDHNTLNNQRHNLRNCSFHENRMNRKLNKNNISGYKGVYITAGIKVNNKRIDLGGFHSVEEAARAYDRAAILYFGEFAHLNFPKL